MRKNSQKSDPDPAQDRELSQLTSPAPSAKLFPKKGTGGSTVRGKKLTCKQVKNSKVTKQSKLAKVNQ